MKNGENKESRERESVGVCVFVCVWLNGASAGVHMHVCVSVMSPCVRLC